MGKGRFLNQKLGKRTSRKLELLKSTLPAQSRQPKSKSRSRSVKFRQQGWSVAENSCSLSFRGAEKSDEWRV